MASKIRSWQYSSCLRYCQDIQKGNTCDGISRIFPAVQRLGRKDVGPLGKFCWSHQICPYWVCTVWYSMRAILLGPDFWCHFNGALYFMLQVLRGNVQWHLAISGPSMATISRSNTSIPLMSHMTRPGFSMEFQWCASICVKSTVWESISISSHYSTISLSYILDKCWYSEHYPDG